MEGLVLNSKKLELRRESHVLWSQIQCPGHASRPQEGPRDHRDDSANRQAATSFLGMVNYMGTFISNLSHHTKPLWAMLKKDHVFHWEEQQTQSFQPIKTLIAKANNTPLRYYDRNLPVTVQADASLRSRSVSHTETQQRGPAHCLCQQEPHRCRDKVCQYRERTSSHHLCLPTFQHLSTGKELRSRERPQTTRDDCLANAPPHLQRMLLELQRYDVTIKYRPGNQMQLADALSCCPARASQEIKLNMRVDYIAFTKPWIEKLKDSTQRDPILVTVYQLTQQGWLHQQRHVPHLARRYWDFRDELSTDDGLLLKGPRLIIPELQEEYVSRLHEGHLSANKVQENARQHMYWTGIDADIEDYTKQCQECIKRSQVAKSSSSLMTYQRVPGGSLAWIISILMATHMY